MKKQNRMLSLVLALLLCLSLGVPALAYGDMGTAGEPYILSAGGNYSAAVDENGGLWMWGDNRYEELNGGGNGVQSVPVRVMDDVAAVSCEFMFEGGRTIAAIKTDGSLWMWGYNSHGRLGNGTTDDSSIPVKVMDGVATVSDGSTRVTALKTDGSLWAWGDRGSGQIGIGTTGNALVPVKLMDDVAAISYGRYGGPDAAIKTDGSLWMWGYNSHGRLGNGTTDDSSIPVKVMDGVASVSGSESTTAAIKTDGSLWMWGYNYSGQLGIGTTDDSLVPVKVMDDVASVSHGSSFTAALKTDGTLWMWGANGSGQLGIGTRDRSLVPVKVMDGVAAVSCQYDYTAAIKTDGSLWTWGNNSSGKLGNGGKSNVSFTSSGIFYSYQTEPLQIMENVAAVSCGMSHTIAVKTDGTLWTWGSNSSGLLGAGTEKRSSGTPIQITLSGGTAMPRGVVRLHLNGGTGGGALWTNASGTITVPTNPTKPGYTFGGWYTDAALTVPWNFNDKVVNTLVLYAKWVPVSSTAATTTKSAQTISLNGNTITLDAYNLVADNGGDVTYVKLRDIAALLEDTGSKFNVDWRNRAIYVSTGTAYTTKNGTELKPISGTDGSYQWNTAPVLFDGTTKALEGIVLTDGAGGGHTFFKLRDLGEAVGFTVGWTAERGIYIETA